MVFLEGLSVSIVPNQELGVSQGASPSHCGFLFWSSFSPGLPNTVTPAVGSSVLSSQAMVLIFHGEWLKVLAELPVCLGLFFVPLFANR